MSSRKWADSLPNHNGVRVIKPMIGRMALSYLSSKSGGIVFFESPVEKTVAQLAELDSRVRRVITQPFTVDVATGKLYRTRAELDAARATRAVAEVRQRDYTPDFLLHLADGRQLVVEVKDARFQGDDDYWEKLLRAEAILRVSGFSFVVITMPYSPTLPLVSNAALLTAFPRDKNLLALDGADAIELMLADGPAPLETVARVAGLSLRESPILLLRGIVGADLRANLLQAQTPVWFAGGDLSHLQLLPLEETKP